MATIGSSRTIPPDLTLQIDTDTNTGQVFVTLVADSGTSILGPGAPADAAQLRLSRLITVAKDNNLNNALEQYNTVQGYVSTAQDEAKQYVKAADAPTGTPKTNNLGGTPASGDQTGDGGTTQAGAGGSGTPTSNVPNTPTNANTAPTSNVVSTNTDKPGTRLQNPLGKFSSYTYQLSLYMITPDAYDAFILSGKKNINALSAVDINGNTTGGGAYLIAQSGGINNTLSKRAPGFELDFYIDDLKIKSSVSSKATRTSSNITDMSFNIIEPMGFSFITKLKRASDGIRALSKLKDYDKFINASKQFFILGIRFQGYDKNGQIASASEYFSEDTLNTNSTASGVYERFYDLTITEMKFKLSNGGPTVYSIKAATIGPTVSQGVARGIVDTNTPVVADTVFNAIGPENTQSGLVSLLGTINKNQQQRYADGLITIPNVYKIQYLGPGSEFIKDATLKSDADNDKKKSEMTKASKTSDVNEATAIKALMNTRNVLVSIPKGTPIPQAIKNIIMHSSYLEGALTTLYTTATENDPNTKDAYKIPNPTKLPLRWYNLSTRLTCLGFDTKVNGFAYEITYVIQPYDTPAATSPYGSTSKYYGPHKRYDYVFTGKNTEIISYEQNFDNTYFTSVLDTTGNPQGQGAGAQIENIPGKQTNQDRTQRSGYGNEAQNTYMTSLFDIGAYANMKMTILGDPDYLAQETPESVNDVYRQFYKADGFTINPNGGQVFIEISFNEAVDYGGIVKNDVSVEGDNGTGLMTVNDKIYFWNYPPEVAAKIKGVSYQIYTVESIFSKGKFTQNLEGAINDIPSATPIASPTPAAIAADNQSAAETARLNRQSTNTTTAAGAPVAVTGLLPDPAIGTSTQPTNLSVSPGAQKVAATNSGILAAIGVTQQTAPTNNPVTPQVVNDDSPPSSSAGATQAGVATTSINTNVSAATDGGRENLITTAQQAIAAGA